MANMSVKEARAIWADDLRNGGHKQVIGLLETPDGWCCHGRACRLAIDNGIPLKVVEDRTKTTFDTRTALPPPQVVDWLGLTTVQVDNLAALNDIGKSFAEIADEIDKLPLPFGED